jgi:hypothetical protein
MWKITLSLESRTSSAQSATAPCRTTRVNGTASMTAHHYSSAARFVQPEFVRPTHGIAGRVDWNLRQSQIILLALKGDFK